MQKLWRLTILCGLLLLWQPATAQQDAGQQALLEEIHKLQHSGHYGRMEALINRHSPNGGSVFGHRLLYYKALAQRQLGKFEQAEATLMASQLSSLTPDELTAQLHQLERLRLWLDVGNLEGAQSQMLKLAERKQLSDSVKQVAVPTMFEVWWQTGELTKHRAELERWHQHTENGCPSDLAAYAQAYLIKLGLATGDYALAKEQLPLLDQLKMRRSSCQNAVSAHALATHELALLELSLNTGLHQPNEKRSELEPVPGYVLQQKAAIFKAQQQLQTTDYQAAVDLLKPLAQEQFTHFPMAHPIQAETYYWLGWAYYYLTGELESTRAIWQKGRALKLNWSEHKALQTKLDAALKLHPTIPLTQYESADNPGLKPLMSDLMDSQQVDWSAQSPDMLRDWATKLLGYQTRLLHLVQFNPWLAARIAHNPAYEQYLANVLQQMQLKLGPDERHLMAYPLLRNQTFLEYRTRKNDTFSDFPFMPEDKWKALQDAKPNTLSQWRDGKLKLSEPPFKALISSLPTDTFGVIQALYGPTPIQQDAAPLNVLQATCEGGHVHFLIAPLADQLTLMAVSHTDVFFEIKPMPSELAKVLELYHAQTAGQLEKPSPLIPVRLYEKLFFSFPSSFRKQGLTWHLHATGDFAGIDYPNLSTELPRRTNQGLLRFPVKSYNAVKVRP